MKPLIHAIVSTEAAATPEMFVGKPFLDKTRTKTLGIVESSKRTARGIEAAIRLNEDGQRQLDSNDGVGQFVLFTAQLPGPARYRFRAE